MSSLSELIAADPSLKPANQHELEIIHMVSSDQRMFRLYRDPALFEKVKNAVPLMELTNKCAHRLFQLKVRSGNSDIAKSELQLATREVFFVLLLEWFKKEFFTWFDCAYCKECQQQMKLFGRSPPTQEETLWDAANVEVYRCDNCLATERFPRYNHPLKLFETRKGRCGEWRNCFSAICVAFSYEIRLVHDFQDHVWNEVYFESQKRWIHCDCCENAFDTPLMYEAGWGKKFVYCIGTSEFEVQDVTMRYVNNYHDLLDRRKGQCRPDWLNRYLLYVSYRLQRNCDSTLKSKLFDRRLAEISSFIVIPGVEKQVKDSEKQGRSSGPMYWRIARGECSSTQNKTNNYIIKFKDNPKDGKYRFTYQSVSDKYFINDFQLDGWESAVFNFDNIFKKVERDWNMIYLSRQENSDCSKKGTLTYKFDVRFNWTKMIIKINTKVYDTGRVCILLTSEPEFLEKEINPDGVTELEKSCLKKDVDYIIMTITLSGGSGNIGWQQSQLFRHSTLAAETDYSLDVIFTNDKEAA